MKALRTQVIALASISLALSLALPGCQEPEARHEEGHKIVVTSPVRRDVVTTQRYVCQIHSRRHIEVRALEAGYLAEIKVKEGQAVKKGDSLFTVNPILYQARLDSEVAEAQQAQIEFANTQRLYEQNVVSKQELALVQARLAKAQAKVKLAKAELNFADVKAPFGGIIDRQQNQQGSLVAEGDILTTMSDNSVMWVYFNVPEARYLEYMADKNKEQLKIELVLANGKTFPHLGKIGAIEADFNNETGNIPFRADFPNPDGLLRHGQTGTVVLSRVVKDALVIPQRATYEILAKKYVYVVDQPGKNADAEHGDLEHSVEAGHASEGELGSDGEPGNDAEEGNQKGHAGEPAAAEDNSREAHAAEQPGEEHRGEHDGESIGVARQREINIEHELDDIYLLGPGLNVNDKIVLEGILQVRDGQKLEYEFVPPEKVLSHLKYRAE